MYNEDADEELTTFEELALKKKNDANRARIRDLQTNYPEEWEALVKKRTTPMSQEEVDKLSRSGKSVSEWF